MVDVGHFYVVLSEQCFVVVRRSTGGVMIFGGIPFFDSNSSSPRLILTTFKSLSLAVFILRGRDTITIKLGW
jgi:hypothetical protein